MKSPLSTFDFTLFLFFFSFFDLFSFDESKSVESVSSTTIAFEFFVNSFLTEFFFMRRMVLKFIFNLFRLSIWDLEVTPNPAQKKILFRVLNFPCGTLSQFIERVFVRVARRPDAVVQPPNRITGVVEGIPRVDWIKRFDCEAQNRLLNALYSLVFQLF